MRAVVYDAYGATPVVREVAPPVCPADGVVVRVGATGVCRSDWHAFVGHDPVPLPMTPGHELAGTVAEVGAEVRAGAGGWAVGDRVTVPFVVACGRCEYCRAGEQQVCPHQQQPGFTYPGSWAELVAVPHAAANLVRLPDDVDVVAAAALGCRFATAFRALHTHAPVGPGDVLAVHGCGGVGLSAVLIGAALGATVVAIDPSAPRRERALELGATRVLDVGRHEGLDAHVSLDAVGSPQVAAASVRSLRRRGTHVQLGLLLGAEAATPLPMDLVLAHELTVVGSHGMPAHEYAALFDLLRSADLDPGLLVDRVLTLDEASDALVALGRAPETGGIAVIRP
ncbi:alcohol dehydrogenase catalytic domain-containing protein [Nocardioides anomalus]|uniref:Alcohol dehydrogenase catalytic domain-containing protein n=1 Tax=Nocardioides anomalus TaxID=2712223 RepID=A0A6G6WKY9_9ACTN|nr:alcohol dehydrogenase catalytic domain-containing protein [Nocardioides anomalus]